MRLSVCVFLVVYVMFNCGCGWVISSDKCNHFAFSASVSSVVAAATGEPVKSIAFTAGLGLLKEIYDGLYGSGFQFGDLAADMAGAVAGGSVAAGICMEEYP